MRAKAGDPPRTMGQRVLASHATSEAPDEDGLIEVKVDQVVLAREPNRSLGLAVQEGLTQSRVEVSIAYHPYSIGLSTNEVDPRAPTSVPAEALGLGFLVAQKGVGFAPAVHLERFGSPARLALTDEPRLASVGATGMLALHASPTQIAEALRTGVTRVRAARSVQIQLNGRLRPFVCVRDVALELLRRGLEERIREVDERSGAPVVLEFYGPAVKLLSVADRAVLAAIAPRLGAVAALFPSDEKTEVFLRDQRRSKAHRVLSADTGASWEDILNIDLAAIDPLLMDQDGRIRPVRDFEGKPISQVLLGGDSGVSLRDILAAAALLKSKRVPPGIEFLLAPPSRQQLEVLAKGGALLDLLATGARLVEPDRRILSGELYPPPPAGVALRTADPEHDQRASNALICSAETLAFGVAYGEVGDPRGLKRPVRITVPRNLPTDDVLLSRGKEA
ncbi:MAG: aconitase family protein, partial [Polyangiaceae bacterium]|nr:aconitase family protein [Polyangiaceae bacterium]